MIENCHCDYAVYTEADVSLYNMYAYTFEERAREWCIDLSNLKDGCSRSDGTPSTHKFYTYIFFLNYIKEISKKCFLTLLDEIKRKKHYLDTNLLYFRNIFGCK
jgi:hypothetical protein